MATSSTSTGYVQVIEDVINNIIEEFINNGGPGEVILTEFQGMMQVGAILVPIDRSSMKLTTPVIPTNHVHDLNVPYEDLEEYETPNIDLLFPPTPMQTPFPSQTPIPGTTLTPLPSSLDSSHNIPTEGTPMNPNDYPPVNNSGASESRVRRPSPYMVERGAASQPTTQDFFLSFGKRKREYFPSQYLQGGHIPQQDRAGDLITNNSELQVPTPTMVNQNDVVDGDEEEPLNENDDDLDDVDHGDEVNTYHLIMAQFIKV
ncbi:unnamed protein product [Lactuca virosa]|uniref:Uncharacterized protein n=1 Tax=Lactuca virosa TaxID=75947 RepID=A0AAU9N1K6_9ASTR|nr:unnamed protein product [Lactuca virosa]